MNGRVHHLVQAAAMAGARADLLLLGGDKPVHVRAPALQDGNGPLDHP